MANEKTKAEEGNAPEYVKLVYSVTGIGEKDDVVKNDGSTLIENLLDNGWALPAQIDEETGEAVVTGEAPTPPGADEPTPTAEEVKAEADRLNKERALPGITTEINTEPGLGEAQEGDKPAPRKSAAAKRAH